MVLNHNGLRWLPKCLSRVTRTDDPSQGPLREGRVKDHHRGTRRNPKRQRPSWQTGERDDPQLLEPEACRGQAHLDR